MGKPSEFTITIKADAVNVLISTHNEDEAIKAEITKAVKAILKQHSCKLLDVKIDETGEIT